MMSGRTTRLMVDELEDTQVMEGPEDDNHYPQKNKGNKNHFITHSNYAESSFGTGDDIKEISDDSESDYDEDPEYQRELNIETQRVLLKTFDDFYRQESMSMLEILAKSREEIKDSALDLIDEQTGFKDELTKVTEGRYTTTRKPENSVPLSVYIRRKRGDTPLELDEPEYIEENVGAITYNGKHPSERLAVEKYIKKRERQKVAQTNRIEREKTNLDSSNKQQEIDRILSAVTGTENIKEKERDRQMEKIQAKLKSAKQPVKNEQEVVNEILEKYNDTQLAFEREKKQQAKRFQRILSSKKQAAMQNPPGSVPNIDI